MTDEFQINGIPKYEALIAPVTKLHVFSASDTVDEPELVRGFHCTVSGVVRVMLSDDTTPTDITVAAGGYYPMRIKRLYSTGTTATIIGLI